MSALPSGLAVDVAEYLRALNAQDDISPELAEQLTRDYHLARLQALYGGSLVVVTYRDASGLARQVREELIRLGKRNSGNIFGGSA